jgi:WD40 repeat protein
VPDHTLLRVIGRGSYGEVWLAQNVMGTYRGVKVVYRSSFDDDGPYEREFAGIRKFEPISRSHESQLDLLHIGRNDAAGCFYYVMELADDAEPGPDSGIVEAPGRGESKIAQRVPTPTLQPSGTHLLHDPENYLPRTLEHDIKARGRLPFEECLRISLALADALRHLHGHGLVHRDIKPGNIIFVNGIPKLADIGLVTDSDATLICFGGSQGFSPPEGPGRPQGDIYSLGKVIYEMCTGRDRMDFPKLPEDFGTWPDRERVSELLDIANKACEPDPRERYGSAEQLSKDLVMVQAGKSVRWVHRLERHRRWTLAALALTVVVAVVASLLVRARTSERLRLRESLVREAQAIRLTERQEDWSSNALHRLARASQRRPDDELRDQAAASLEGLDARVAKSFRDRPVNYLGFDPQGRRVLVDGGGHGHVEIWNVQSYQINTLTSTNSGPVWFASGGSPRQLAYKGRGVFVLLNPEDGRTLQEFHFPGVPAGEDLALQALTLSADASLCAASVGELTNETESKIAVWETATGKLVAQATEARAVLAFSPDNTCLAVGDDAGRVSVRALPSLTNVVVAFHQDHTPIHCIAFARDPSQAADGLAKYPWLLATGDAGGTINIYQVALGRLKSICRGSQYDVYTVAFSPDGMTLASGGREAIHFWDVATGRSLLTVREYDNHHALAFSPDGSKLAFGTVASFSPGISGVIDLEPSRGVMALRGLSSQSAKVEFSHDGQRLAALSHNWEVGIWNLASNRLEWLLQAPKGLFADNAALAFSRDDSQLAFATLTDARLWDLKTGGLSNSWRLPRGLVQQLCFDPAGRLLHFQMDLRKEKQEAVCKVRDLSRTDYEKPLAVLPDFSRDVFDAVLSPDCLVVAGQGTNGTDIVRAFDPVSGRDLFPLPVKGQMGHWLARDPEGSRVGCWLEAIKATVFFDLRSRKLWCQWPGKPIFAVAPDGTRLAAQAPNERGMLVLGADNPTWRLTLGIDHKAAMWPRFSPNGRLIAWGTSDGTVLVGDMEETVRRLDQLGLGWR